jgi:glycerol-3-phosphate cytidylyltransferase-like family protein
MDYLLNGCFDLMHPGHFLAIQKIVDILNRMDSDSNTAPSRLILGLHAVSEIYDKKGTVSVYTDEDKIKILSSIKNVHGMILNVPYRFVTEEWLNSNGIFKAVHGDDRVYLNGVDMYGKVDQAGRYLEIERTPGISTTDLIDEILTQLPATQASLNVQLKSTTADNSKISKGLLVGSFGLLHPGIVEILERLRKNVVIDELAVGIIPDTPGILKNPTDRLISLRSCKFVDNVFVISENNPNMENTSEYTNILISGHSDFIASHELFTNHNNCITVDCSDIKFDSNEVYKRVHKNHEKFLKRQSLKKNSTTCI